MSDKLMISYKERFAVAGIVSSKDVTDRFAELGCFLDGFFVGLAHEQAFDLLCPSVHNISHFVVNDEKINITRIMLEITVYVNMVRKEENPRLQMSFNNAMNAFLGSRFTNYIKR